MPVQVVEQLPAGNPLLRGGTGLTHPVGCHRLVKYVGKAGRNGVILIASRSREDGWAPYTGNPLLGSDTYQYAMRKDCGSKPC